MENINYLQKTEKIIELIHEFEREEIGQKIFFVVICRPAFVEDMKNKLEQGRFGEFLCKDTNARLCLNGDNLSNSYHFFTNIVRDSAYRIYPGYSFIYVSLDIDDGMLLEIKEAMMIGKVFYKARRISYSKSGQMILFANISGDIPQRGDILSTNVTNYSYKVEDIEIYANISEIGIWIKRLERCQKITVPQNQ